MQGIHELTLRFFFSVTLPFMKKCLVVSLLVLTTSCGASDKATESPSVSSDAAILPISDDTTTDVAEEPPTPWENPVSIYATPYIADSCDVILNLQLPPTSAQIEKLHEAGEELWKSFELSLDPYIGDRAVDARAIVEYYRKYPNDDRYPFTYQKAEEACKDSNLQYWLIK